MGRRRASANFLAGGSDLDAPDASGTSCDDLTCGAAGLVYLTGGLEPGWEAETRAWLGRLTPPLQLPAFHARSNNTPPRSESTVDSQTRACLSARSLFGQDGPSPENSRPLRAGGGGGGPPYQQLRLAYGSGNWILHKQTQDAGTGRSRPWDYM